MVKFSKQLDGQLVPEWRAAYLTYKLLKKDLKHMKQVVEDQRSRELSSPSFGTPGRRSTNFSRVQDSFGSFVALTGQALGGHILIRRSRRDSVVQVKKVESDPWEIYETELVNLSELDATFFARLDSQFNKVNQFYKTKENDFVEQADVLEKQMCALIEMRKIFAEQQRYQHLPAAASGSDDDNQIHDLEAGRDLLGSRHPTEADDSRSTNALHACLDIKGSVAGGLDRDNLEGEISEISVSPDTPSGKLGNEKTLSPRMTMRMRVPVTTPSSAISMLSHTLWGDVVKLRGSSSPEDNEQKASDPVIITKKKIQLAEKMLRAAFIEYYRGLGMLKSYSSLNMVAFAKILKKYDKISGQRAAAAYLKAVETSYFNTSDKIVKLMDKVEVLFTEHFASYNRRKAMMSLRPRQKRASHNVTFALGLFSGGSLALVAVFAVLMHDLLPKYRPVEANGQQEALPADDVYFETIFPVFSMVALILLHMYMYGANLFYWRRMRINYPFIFEFQPGTELRHREVLMVTSILTTLLIGAMVGQLTLHTATLSPYVDLIPFCLVVMLVILLLFPLNIFYRSSRVFLLTALIHIVGSPLYKVVLADFFLADQLTSQVPMLRNMEYVMCFYLGGFFRTGSPQKCTSNHGYRGLTYLISLLPYWWRLMQCARRYIDEVDSAHIANGGKYLSALVAVAIRIQYGNASSKAWLAMSIVSSTVATFYQAYWDVVVDWGLLRRDAKNRWLRDQLIMPKKKYIYFLSMGVNVVLRLAWLQSVTRFKFGGLNQQVADFGFAALEVVRRGHWNFYRLENEHLNNVGKYRATKTVPLPFEDPTADEDE
ncbi:unnamed protein product [Calypogeia fissa]